VLAWLARGLPLPDTRRLADEDLGRAIDPLRLTYPTRHRNGEHGNLAREARYLRFAGLAFDQGLACSDQDWHTGRVAPEVVERQTKGESKLSSAEVLFVRLGVILCG
jgi:hypothetical protein